MSKINSKVSWIRIHMSLIWRDVLNWFTLVIDEGSLRLKSILVEKVNPSKYLTVFQFSCLQ